MQWGVESCMGLAGIFCGQQAGGGGETEAIPLMAEQGC